MINQFISFLVFISLLSFLSCKKKDSSTSLNETENAGLKIAYVNGDSILMNFEEFRAESKIMEEKQRKAEEDLQKKGAALEREIMTYQKEAQTGMMTGKQMESRERELGRKQETLIAERDKIAKEIMDETGAINERLQKVLQDRLKEIKEKEGYDFIFSYIAGGPILVADERYDITKQVLEELNKTSSGKSVSPDTTVKK